MTTATIEKPRTATYAEKVEALLASGSPVRMFDQYGKFKAAASVSH
ncbi:hypothetical protein K8W59_07250 [Nocardioides rotundus]|nr:hypothetical protein [Nocardioides rotundus]UAL31248.1 hypothetical protein K8W59_07250 [Nocardioides rotundus]